MWTLVSYDITCAKRRTRVLKRLRGYAINYQDSVFELDCTRNELANLAGDIQSLVDETEDKVLFIRLNKNTLMEQLGTGLLPVTGFLMIVD